MSFVSEGRLLEVYNQITTETNVRFTEGAANLKQINKTLLSEIERLNVQVHAFREEVNKSFIDIRTETGIEMDKRIRKRMAEGADQHGTKATGSMLNDPRNKVVEHFSGYKPEDRKIFETWRKKTFNHPEKFIPHAKVVLTKLTYADEEPDEMAIASAIEELDDKWDSRCTTSVLCHQLKVFLTEHLDGDAVEIVEDEEDGVLAWRALTLHFEPKSLVGLSNLKSHINDINKETAKSYEKLQELVRELGKRIRKYEERGGKFSREDAGSIIYTMMDENLKKDARR